GADHPAVVQLKDEMARSEKQIANTRSKVEVDARSQARKQLEGKIADLEDRLSARKEVLEVRKRLRDEVQKNLAETSRVTFDVAALSRELDPQREFLRQLESELRRLRNGSDLGTPLAVRPVG